MRGAVAAPERHVLQHARAMFVVERLVAGNGGDELARICAVTDGERREMPVLLVLGLVNRARTRGSQLRPPPGGSTGWPRRMATGPSRRQSGRPSYRDRGSG